MQQAFMDKLKKWHEDEQHQDIVDAIAKVPRSEWDYELSSLYARALNNLERYEEALEVLKPLEAEGKEDGLWYFRVGYSLYYLCKEAEAAEYFQKALDYGDDSEDTQQFLEASLKEAAQRENNANGGESTEMYSEAELDALESHITKYFGTYKNVFHEFASPDIHVDIVVIEPTPERNYYVLCTMGMGARRMAVPPECENLERAELLVCLPPDWKLEKINEEEWYWPLRWLKILARLPIEENTWLGWGHTVPNGEPFATNTSFTTVLLLNPGAFNEAAQECTLPGGEIVNFYQMVPLYEEESQFKINNKAERLLSLLEDDALEYVRLDRPCVIPRVEGTKK
jgi:tetratricopeptide (TPR) repeat protein